MTVRELISELEKFDPEMRVGGSGHFGELLNIDGVKSWKYHAAAAPYVAIEIEYAGEEPD